jgi:hypothetical protein
VSFGAGCAPIKVSPVLSLACRARPSSRRPAQVPKQMIESMVATGSAEIRWVDAIEDKLERPPSIAEWEDASCGTFTGQENNTMLHLRVRRLAQPLSQEESLFLNLLLEKLQKKVQCEGALISSHRERLAPP